MALNPLIDKRRERFLRDEFHGLTLGATTQRGNVYPKGLTETARGAVHETLRCVIDEMSLQYASGIAESAHLANIETLASTISNKHARVVSAGRFRIGSAQKALNLFLKYLWCSGIIPTPPHCPFDARVIAKLPPADRCNWTTLDDLSQYARLVDSARKLADNKSLAEWELDLYNDVSVAAVRARRFISPAI
jgi:hypothetical protein